MNYFRDGLLPVQIPHWIMLSLMFVRAWFMGIGWMIIWSINATVAELSAYVLLRRM